MKRRADWSSLTLKLGDWRSSPALTGQLSGKVPSRLTYGSRMDFKSKNGWNFKTEFNVRVLRGLSTRQIRGLQLTGTQIMPRPILRF